MLFNSAVFIIFLAGFFIVWPFVRARNNLRWAYLTATSLFFYGWWDWHYVFLLLFTGTVDYLAALAIDRWPRHKKIMLGFSLASNLGVLALFKYLDFFIANLNWGLGLGGIHPLPLAHLVLPVGISFYTFQALSYTIDVYRGELRAERNYLHYFAFLVLFPQLVAGPIVRAADLLPQLRTYNLTNESQRWSGFQLILFGYFKKVVIADTLAPLVNEAFRHSALHDSGAYWWIVIVMFAFQIYCDFSGYSDIARGLARWMGYEFMVNFDHPYIATSIREFWSRWHISLSTWFRDYLYIPLGGSRRGAAAGHLNMWITMVTSGLWHGAAWTFVAWGALHAAYLSLERVTEWPRRLAAKPGGRHLCLAIVFLMVLVSWVFFRAQSFGQAAAILGAMFDFTRFNAADAAALFWSKPMALVGLMMLRQLWFHIRWRPALPAGLRPHWERALQPAALALLVAACVFFRGPGSAFIYFQF